jgi:MscS family membrane protein
MPVLLDIDWSFFNHQYLGETVTNYLWFAGIVVFTILLKNPMALLLTRLSSLLTIRFSYVEHKGAIREILFKPMEKLVQVVLFFIAFNQVDGVLDRFAVHKTLGKIGKLNFTLGDVVNHIFLLVFIIFLTQFIARFIDFIYYIRISIAQKEKNNALMQLLPLIKEMSKLVLWIISCFWILGSVCHVNIPALITGLGIGGVAIALAGKETVENFFAAFTILSDKPFHTGDTIKLGEIEAVVERIGFRSTRLRNLDGSAYIIPNQNLVSQNLINMSMRVNRHVKIAVNVK